MAHTLSGRHAMACSDHWLAAGELSKASRLRSLLLRPCQHMLGGFRQGCTDVVGQLNNSSSQPPEQYSATRASGLQSHPQHPSTAVLTALRALTVRAADPGQCMAGTRRQSRQAPKRPSRPPNSRPAIWSLCRAAGTWLPAWMCSFTMTRYRSWLQAAGLNKQGSASRDAILGKDT